MSAMFAQTHTGFRYRNDDGSETGATWIYANDTDGDLNVDTIYRMRIEMTESGGAATNNVALQWEYNHSAAPGWNSVTASAAPIQAVSSAETSWTITDADDTTQQLGGGGTYETPNAAYTEGGLGGGASLDWGIGTLCETELCFQIPAGQVADNDTILLRCTAVGKDNVYTTAPTIVVNEAAGAITINCTAGVANAAGVAGSVAPGAITITSPAPDVLASSGLAATISSVPPAQQINCTEGVLASAGIAASVTPGGITVTATSEAVLASAGETASVTPGAVIVASPAPDILASAGHAVIVSAAGAGAQTVTCTDGVLASAGVFAGVDPGAVTITATGEAVLSSAGLSAALEATTTIQTTEGTLASSGIAAIVTPGAVSIACAAGVLASATYPATITGLDLNTELTIETGIMAMSGHAISINRGLVFQTRPTPIRRNPNVTLIRPRNQ